MTPAMQAAVITVCIMAVFVGIAGLATVAVRVWDRWAG